MLVTELSASGKTKCKVYLDYEYAFMLSNREAKRYKIEVNQEISDDVYAEIMNELILPKAKLKAMDLLKSMDRTEMELMNKLRLSGFADSVCQYALDYVKKFNYINDYRYACNYINYRKSNKSLKMLQLELSRKGVDKQLIHQAVEEEYHYGMEEEAVRLELNKKCRNLEELTYEKRMKISASLYRKGYSPSVIRKVLGDLELYDET